MARCRGRDGKVSDLHKALAVIIGTLVALIVAAALAANIPCKRCKKRGADCECER
jgi:hypothetical protein